VNIKGKDGLISKFPLWFYALLSLHVTNISRHRLTRVLLENKSLALKKSIKLHINQLNFSCERNTTSASSTLASSSSFFLTEIESCHLEKELVRNCRSLS